MAEATARNFEGDQAKFEGKQLAALNALHATNPDVVDLTAVETAGIITAETRTKIEAAVPNHQLLFQRAVAKERREASSEVAYRRAFQAIYGRFLLEQGDSDLEKPSGPVMKALGQVLKFQLTAEGLRGRSELRAAVRYLRLSRVTNQQSQALLAEQTTLNGQITSLEPDALALSTAVGAFAEFDDLRTRIGSLPTTPGSPETLACFTEISGVVNAIQNLKDTQVAGIEAAYQAILRKRDGVESNNYPAAMVQDLFIAVGNWKVRIENASTQKNDELNQARERLTTVNQDLTALGGNVLAPEDVIKEAFPGITIDGGTIKIHGFETSFTHVAKVLKAAQDYFESPEEMSALRDSHRDLSNLIEKSSNEAFREELSSNDVGFKDEDFKKGIQAQINKLEAKIDAIKRSTIQDQRNATEQQRAANESLREARAEKVGRLSEALRVLKDNLDAAKRLHAEMQKLIKKLGVAVKAGVVVIVDGNPLNLSEIINNFKKVDLRGTDFQPSQLLGVYKMFEEYFESDTNVAGFASEIEKAKKEVMSSTDLTDAAAAKKIIAVMVAKQFPEAGLEEQQKIAAMVLAGDIATLHTDLGYNALAQRASAELLDTVSQAGFKEKLIGLRYKDGEKTEQPFKDLKPENFKDWASIEKLFTIGRLNHQNGFLVLAALEIFDGDVRSVQSVRTERKLKELLAKQLGVDERMDEAGVNKIVNDAFEDQMKKVRPLVATYFGHYDTHAAEWSGYKVKELNLRYEKLQEERRLGKVGEALYGKRMAELVKEATEANIMSQVDFSQDSVMAGYWDSPEAQWLRDRGHDVGKYAGHKALALGKGGLRVAGRALLGTAGLAGSLAVHTALLPFRVAKYPLMLAAKPLVGFINLFRSSKWQPFSIVGSVRTDLGRVGGYFSGKASGVWTGTQEAVKAVPEELGHAKYEGKKYKDRTTVDMAALEAEAKELKEKAEATPIVIAGSPFIDLQKYKDQVAKLDRILAGGGGGSSGGGAAKKEAA